MTAAPASIASPVSVLANASRVGQSFAAAPDRGDLVRYPAQRIVRRDGAYTWHRADLSEAHATAAIADGRLSITAPSGDKLDFRYERHVEHASGDWTWVGRLEHGAQSDEVVLTFGAKAAFGTIAQRGGKAPLKLTIQDGVAWLVETDLAKIAGIANRATRPHGDDYLVSPKLAGAPSLAGDAPAAESAPTAVASTASSGTTVDVVLGYTTGFASALGGQSQAVTRLNNMVDLANQAFANAQVAGRIRLVHTLQVNYADNTSNSDTLEKLTGYKSGSGKIATDPAFSALRAARDQYGADLVSLVRKFNDPENDGCGIAWMIGGDQSGFHSSDDYFGYSVVSDGRDAGTDGKTYFCREETLAHELGHNMGSQHDRTTATKDGELKYGAYPYSFGYKTDSANGNFYTVMAYGDSGQTNHRVFSNPRITFCGGYACGITDQADNVRSLSQTMPIIAGFRSTVVQDPTPAPGAVFNDVDGDAKSDLFWFNGGSVAWWRMNGSAVVTTGGQAAPAGGVVATGDLDGDRRVDIVWQTDAGRLVLWRNTGGGYNAEAIGDYPYGWTLAGAHDIDGDGKSDLLWHNGTTLAWWRMSGAAILSTGGQSTGAGSRVIAAGDFNADSKADLVLQGESGGMTLWSSSGDSFAASAMPLYPVGWTLIGAVDMSGDGKSELLWYNGTTLAWWRMSGASVIASGGQGVGAGAAVVSVGDFDGDGRGDIVWSHGADSLSLWKGAESGFTSEALGAYPEAWSPVRAGARSVLALAAADRNGDARSDLLWHNGTTLAWWHLQGTSVTSTGGFQLGTGSTVLGEGQFNGDGRADVVWRDSADSLHLAVASGSGFASTRITGYPTGWSFAGASDINGDGRSDLLWHNGSMLAWWHMDGVSIVTSGGQSMGTNSSVLGTGDVDGDGRGDVIWRDGGNRLNVWIARRSGFVSVPLGDYPAGWQLMGVGDLNGDQRADFLWHNGSMLAWWHMRSGVVVATGGRSMGDGSRVLAVIDADGSGRADVLWQDSANNVRLWSSVASGFAEGTVSSYPTGWSIVRRR